MNTGKTLILIGICAMLPLLTHAANNQAISNGEWGGSYNEDINPLLRSGAVVTVSQGQNYSYNGVMHIGATGGNANPNATLDVTNGTLYVAKTASTASTIANIANSHATLKVSGQGEVTYGSALYVGNNASSDGSRARVELSTGGILNITGELRFGTHAQSLSELSMNGGTLNADSNVSFGYTAGAQNTAEISGGTLNATSVNIFVGYSGNATLAVSGSGSVKGAGLYISSNTGARGNVTLSGGELDISGNIEVGRRQNDNNTNGSLFMTGGTLKGANLFIGAGRTNRHNITGNMAIMDGTAIISSAITIGHEDAAAGSGHLTIGANASISADSFNVQKDGMVEFISDGAKVCTVSSNGGSWLAGAEIVLDLSTLNLNSFLAVSGGTDTLTLTLIDFGNGAVSIPDGIGEISYTALLPAIPDTLYQVIDFGYNETQNAIMLSITAAIPEPATYAFLAVFGAAAFVLYRRRKE